MGALLTKSGCRSFFALGVRRISLSFVSSSVGLEDRKAHVQIIAHQLASMPKDSPKCMSPNGTLTT